MKITVNEAKARESKNEARSFDYSEVEQDSKKFDFVNLLSRLSQFKGWLEDLQAQVPEVETPRLCLGSQGSSGFDYHISGNVFSQGNVGFSIDCGTNPAKHQKFWGTIYAGDKKFLIDSIDDLTDQLIKDIAAAFYGKASRV